MKIRRTTLKHGKVLSAGVRFVAVRASDLSEGRWNRKKK